MRYLSEGSHVEVPHAVADALLDSRTGEAQPWVRGAAARLMENTTVVVRAGALRWAQEPSRLLVSRIATAVVDTLKDEFGLPAASRLLMERPERTGDRHPYPTRTLLPHHDGQHRSYLTPSALDSPGWAAADRTFSSAGFVRSGAQTMYQGFFVASAGHALSLTAYYDLLELVETAYGRRVAPRPDVRALARWTGTNVRAAKERQARHGARYLTIAGLCGVERPEFEAMSYEVAQAPVPQDVQDRFPSLVELKASCPCGLCLGETERVYCHVLSDVFGLAWPAFRAQHELGLPSQDFDLVLSENITVLHSGIDGGRDRLLEPVSVVVDCPEGPDYEEWLSRRWRRPRLRALG